MLQYQTILVF